MFEKTNVILTFVGIAEDVDPYVHENIKISLICIFIKI